MTETAILAGSVCAIILLSIQAIERDSKIKSLQNEIILLRILLED